MDIGQAIPILINLQIRTQRLSIVKPLVAEQQRSDADPDLTLNFDSHLNPDTTTVHRSKGLKSTKSLCISILTIYMYMYFIQ
jgi:hypothetical protein